MPYNGVGWTPPAGVTVRTNYDSILICDEAAASDGSSPARTAQTAAYPWSTVLKLGLLNPTPAWGLVEIFPGWLCKAKRLPGSFQTFVSSNGGVAWAAGVTATPAPARNAVPALSSDGWSGLHLWYHDASNARCYYSDNWGASWSLYATQPGYKWPCVVQTSMGPVLAVYHTGSGEIRFFQTDDWGITLGSQLASVAAAAHPYSLAVDRHGLLHLVYQDGAGDLAHRWSEDAVTWSAPTTWLVGRSYPALASGTFQAFLSCYQGLTMEAYTVDQDWAGVTAAAAHPAAALSPGTPAPAIVDHREHGWVTPTYLTVDDGASWQAPV